MDNPKVSVIMPVYNAENYIDTAVKSILNQSYKNFELIIIDDCPTDSSMEIIMQYSDVRIRVFHNEQNSGISYSRNKGLDYSRGEYIAIMDDDDISMPLRLEKQIQFLDTHDNIDIVGGRFQMIDAKENIIRPSSMVLQNPNYIKSVLLFKNIFANSELTFRKSFIQKHNIRYRENCLGMEDFRFWIECSKVGNISGIDELVLKFRRTEENETSRTRRDLEKERAQKYAEFQRYSLYQSGFRLDNEMLSIINKVMAEKNGTCDNKFELSAFHKALNHIVCQSRQMACENSAEVEIFCRTILAEKISKMDELWGIL